MNKIESRLGLPRENRGARQIALALINEYVAKLQDAEFEDPPPSSADFPWIDINNAITVEDDQVRDLNASLPGTWKDHPLPILLIAAFDPHNDLEEELTSIVAKTVHLSLMLAQMGDEYRHEIVLACRRARLLFNRDRFLLPHLPSFKQSFETIADQLKVLADKPPDELKPHAKRLGEWHDCIVTFTDNREKHTRHAYGSDVSVDGERVEHPLPDDDDVSLSISEPPITVPFPNSPEEARDDQPKSGKAVRALLATTPQDRSRGMAQNRGREILNRLFMSFSAPPCHYNRLTPHQVQRSFEICYRRSATSDAYLITALTIITGRQAPRLLSLEMRQGGRVKGPGECWIVESGQVFLRYEPELPKHDRVTSQKGIRKTSDNGIRIAVPHRLGNALLKLYRGKRHLKRSIDIHPAIKSLSHSIDKKITAGRLNRTLTHYLDSEGVDDVLTTWLTGGSPKHNAGMYYTLISRADAAATHTGFVNTLLEKSGAKERVEYAADSSYVGTRLRINPTFIAQSFQLQAVELENALRNSQATCPYAFHNRFVLYVAQLLGLVTLIRSVTEPFGRYDDTNLLGRTVRIADKVNRLGVSAGRLVSLGQTAITQLECFNGHLHGLYQDLRHHQPETASGIKAALDGSGSYLCMIDRKRKVRPLKPKWLLAELRDAWPFPANWPRHSLSAWLRRQGFTKGAIRGHYGHSDLGPAPLSRFDGTTVHELSTIADVIDDYLSQHDIRSVQGWNTRT